LATVLAGAPSALRNWPTSASLCELFSDQGIGSAKEPTDESD
jgi:hypothetical protein